MYFLNRGFVPLSRIRRGTAMYLSNRADAPPDQNQPWAEGVYSNQAEMSGLPPFQRRIPCHRPMCSKSTFLYTSITSSRTSKIPCPEGGVHSPPPGTNRGHQAGDIHQRPVIALASGSPAPVPRGSGAQRAWLFPPNHPATVPGSAPATLSQQLQQTSPRPKSAIPAIQSIQSG